MAQQQKTQLPPPAGYWDLLALLRVLSDPGAYEERLQELEGLRSEIVERQATEESYERQQALESDAKGKLAEANQLLNDARVNAAAIRVESERDSAAIRESLRISREEWGKERAKQQDTLSAQLKALEERERVAREAVEKAKTTLSRGEYLMSEASKLQAEYQEKVAKLKGLVS
jgi:hypothetical protein